jgi:hypothetical protein
MVFLKTPEVSTFYFSCIIAQEVPHSGRRLAGILTNLRGLWKGQY